MDLPTQWIRAVSLADAPEDGSGNAYNIDGLDIAIFNWDQGYFALENLCPHLGFPLTEGMVQNGTVICGWHGWRVQLGDGSCFGKTLAARTFPCEVRDDAIWVQVPKTV